MAEGTVHEGGIVAARQADGSVTIDAPGKNGRRLIAIDEETWIGLVAGVSKDGANPTSIRCAGMVHASRTKIDVGINGQTIAQAVMVTVDAVILPLHPEIVVPHG
jgi:hypothetical protein